MALDFSSLPALPRCAGQTRFNTSGSGNGTDIYARSINTAALNDSGWHMLTWTFDTTTGVLNSYFDGAVVETFNSAATSFNMIASTSALGTFGLKGDSGNFLNGTINLDEGWVFNQVLTADEVSNLYSSNNIAVPEPGSLVLAGFAALALGAVGLRRRSR